MEEYLQMTLPKYQLVMTPVCLPSKYPNRLSTTIFTYSNTNSNIIAPSPLLDRRSSSLYSDNVTSHLKHPPQSLVSPSMAINSFCGHYQPLQPYINLVKLVIKFPLSMQLTYHQTIFWVQRL